LLKVGPGKTKKVLEKSWNFLTNKGYEPCYMYIYIFQGSLLTYMYIYIFQGLGVPLNIASYSLLIYMYIYIFQGLGVPFNIASYSLLIYMIAHVTGLQVKPLY
jgi:thymidylate synthase